MILETITVGSLETNCYLFGDETTGEAILIDPGAEAERIKTHLNKCGLQLKCIVNTHGHADHIAANTDFDVPIWIHSDDADFLVDGQKNLSAYLDEAVASSPATRLLKEGDLVEIGGLALKVLHTPGHTPGGICLKFVPHRDKDMDSGDKPVYSGMYKHKQTSRDGCLFVFTGDTLFAGGTGRTDFPGASNQQLWTSIRKKLFVLPDETIIYPGHGPSSTIGREKVIYDY